MRGKKAVGLILLSFVFFLGLGSYQLREYKDNKLHVTFCDVGQGDAVYIRTPSGKDILFDGGPNDQVLTCLANSMPFWDRTIDLVILSHPHADHLNGLVDVIEVYKVKQFATEDLENKSDGFEALQAAVESEGIAWQTLLAGDRIRLKDGVSLTVIGPTKEYLTQTSVDGKFITSTEFASLEVVVSYGEFDVLLTGDSQNTQLYQAFSTRNIPSIDVLQVPHHGSRTGLTDEIVRIMRPQEAIISVGKNNYGHPSPIIVNLLQKYGVKISRTDKVGDVKLTSDGKSYNIK